MAIVAMVSKVWPKVQDGHFLVGVEVVLTDDSVEKCRQVFSETVNKTADVSLLANQLAAKAQVMIDDYKAEKIVYGHVKMTALVTAIQNGITV